MGTNQINPTRMELTKLKKKLATATKGHKLLKDKRDELMRQFLEIVKINKLLRNKVEKAIGEANKNFVLAGASMTEETMSVSMLVPKQEIYIEVETKNILSIEIPKYKVVYRSPDVNDMFCYGLAFTSADLEYAVVSLSSVLPDMIKLAEIETSCKLMAEEIEKTRRRVNALEYVMIPEYKSNIRYIKMKLDENERSSQTRLLKVKDIMLNEVHGY